MTTDISFYLIDEFIAVSAPGGTKFERNIHPNLDVSYSRPFMPNITARYPEPLKMLTSNRTSF